MSIGNLLLLIVIMKTMILVWGTSERGKSQSIKKLAQIFPFETIIRPWQDDDYDSYVIGTVRDQNGKERIVGIENQSDPNSQQEEWVKPCIDANCDVIVAACRSYGKTNVDAYQLGYDNEYYVFEASTLFHEDGPTLPNGIDLREVFAKKMTNIIMRCLN